MHDDCAINIEWGERLNLQENKERKKKIKEKLLMANKGKFIVDYKTIWNQDNTYNYIPADIICILKDEDILDKVKENIITKLKAAGFNLKISPVNGGESLNFESFQVGSGVKSQTFKIPIKLYTRNKKIMVQGTPDCQILFMKYFREFSVFGHSTPLKTKEPETA